MSVRATLILHCTTLWQKNFVLTLKYHSISHMFHLFIKGYRNWSVKNTKRCKLNIIYDTKFKVEAYFITSSKKEKYWKVFKKARERFMDAHGHICGLKLAGIITWQHRGKGKTNKLNHCRDATHLWIDWRRIVKALSPYWKHWRNVNPDICILI